MSSSEPGRPEKQPPATYGFARNERPGVSDVPPVPRALEADRSDPMSEPAPRPYPDGWFPVASSAEMRPGRVVNRRLAGEDVVVYRTQSGRLRAVRPYCPHLGAHLGHGGRVRGENLVCPFHHFAFGPEGECVQTGYGTTPPKARLGVLECREAAGLVFVWRHARGAPASWEIEEPSTDGFGPPHCTVRTLRAHPQDFMENVIDTGHFQPVHKFSAGVLDAPHFDGPRMTSTYRLRGAAGKANALFNLAPTTRMVVQGLGILFTEADLRTIGMQLRTWFCVAPLDPGRIELRTALSVRFPRLRHRGTARILAATLPKPLVWASGRDINRDGPIWANKIYLEHPRLAQGDGPITKYRRWARQFYSD